MSALAEAAERLRSMHSGADPLILANAWDAASALAVEHAGFGAAATTSSGVATVLGWADGEGTPAAEMFAAIGRISRVLTIPLTADIESGYGLPPAEIVRRLLESGAVGCNLEDTDHATGGHTVREANAQAERLVEFKRAARAAGVDVVLNARTDVFLRLGPGESLPIEEAIRRGRLYLEAGADCIFPIGVADEGAIAALVDGIPGPINVIPRFRGAPGLARLRQLGVRRMSYAGRVHHAVYAEHRRLLAAIRSGEEF